MKVPDSELSAQGAGHRAQGPYALPVCFKRCIRDASISELSFQNFFLEVNRPQNKNAGVDGRQPPT
jgi:hypothetical protein